MSNCNSCDKPQAVGSFHKPDFVRTFRVDFNYTIGDNVSAVDVAAPEVEEGDPPAPPVEITLPNNPKVGQTVSVNAIGADVLVFGGCFEICGVSPDPDDDDDDEEEEQGSITVAACTSAEFVFTSGDSGGKCGCGEGQWLYRLGATSSQSFGQGTIILPTLADVAAFDDEDIVAGTELLPLDLGQSFVFDPTSTLAANGISILNTPSSDGGALPGRYLRQLSHVPRWTKQATWFVDPTNGLDTNDGATAATALQTMRELTRRLQYVTFQTYTVNLLGDIPSSDNFDLNPKYDGEGSSGPAASLTVPFNILGQAAVETSGTVVAATGSTPATNTQASLTASFALGTLVGRLVRVTTGALAGSQAWILADLGASVRLSNWFNPTTQAVPAVGVAPAPGDTVQVVRLTEINLTLRFPGVPFRLVQNWTNVRFTPTSQIVIEDLNITFTSADINTNTFSFPAGTPPRGMRDNALAVFVGSLLRPANNRNVLVFDLRARFLGSALLNSDISLFNTGHLEFSNTVVQSGQVRSGVNPGNSPAGDTSPCGASTGIFQSTYGLAIFDAPLDAFLAARNSLVTLDAPLYGSGNANYGVHVRDGSNFMIRDGITPTITGILAQVRIDNPSGGIGIAASIVTPMVAGAVPITAAPFATWADWNGAPFTRFAFNPATGSRIISVPTAV